MSADQPISRRGVLVRSSAALLSPQLLRSAPSEPNLFAPVLNMPDAVSVFSEDGMLSMSRSGSAWQANNVEIRINSGARHSAISLRSPQTAVLRVRLRWQLRVPLALSFLGDQWERSYGDLAWRHMEPDRIMPWYFLATSQTATYGCAVKTGAAALCFWQIDPEGVCLWLDVRNGGVGVKLNGRELNAATIVSESYSGISPFRATAKFCRTMCDRPRLPASPVYGGNNWYYAYGKSSASDIRADSERLASVAPNSKNRPFMVIDDGWQPNATAGPWIGSVKFPDMPGLASDMQRIGVRPGIWIRPLYTKEQVPAIWRLHSPNAEREFSSEQSSALDPTVPDVLAKIQSDIKAVVSWGYSLIKHDFSTYDLLGRWGSKMNAEITDGNWGFQDRTRTNAEIMRDFYAALRDAAGNALILGCNTIGHLTAGLFELQRTGDDTSGRDWNRTRKMGINTLAFRAPQHNAFFAIDADCVGLTREIPWELNRQWLDLLARSGTPLFVSAAPQAFGAEQKQAMREAFQTASQPQPLAEPTDWLQNNEPQRWSFASGRRATYNWFGSSGTSPFPG